MKQIQKIVSFVTRKAETTDHSIWQKIGKNCLYLIIFLAPLFFLPVTVAPVEINKQFLTQFLVFVTLICCLADAVRQRKITYPRSWLALAVLVLFLATAIGAIFSLARIISFSGNFVQPDSLLNFLVYGLIFFLAANFFKKEDLGKLVTVFCVSFVITLLFGLLQIFGKFIFPWVFAKQTNFNAIGSVVNWGVFVAFALAMIMTALSYLSLSKWWRAALVVIGLLAIFALIALNYQFLWFALALTMLLLVAYKFFTSAHQNLSFTLPLALMALSLFFILIGPRPSLVNVPTEIRPNLSANLAIIKGAFRGTGFLFGSGPATFSYDWVRFRPVEINNTNFWSARFNQGFSFAGTQIVTNGLLGLAAFLFMLFCFVWQSFKFKSEKNDHLVVAVGVLFLMVILFLYPSFFVGLLFLFLTLGVMNVFFSSNREFNLSSSSKPVGAFLTLIILIILMAFGAALLYSSSQKYIAAIYYGQGLKNLAENNLAKAMVKLDKASAFDGQSDQYLRTMSQALLLQANELAKQASAASNPQNNQLQIQQSVALAVQKARLAVSLNPSDSFNWSNLANVYENIISAVQGADTFAIENYKKAMTLDPKNPQEVVNLARVYLSMADRMQGTESQKEEWQKKLNEAQKILEQALTLKADYAPAHFQVAMIYVREGKTKEAIERLEAAKTAAPLDAGLAFQLGLLYYNTDQVDQAQAEFERAVAVDQNYSNARYFLGLTYDQKGLKLKAMEQFSKIAALNPTNQEVPKIINNLREGKPVLEGLVPPSEPPLERTEAPVEEETPTEP